MKKMLKAVLSATLALVMLLSVIPMTVSAAYNLPFSDVTSSDYFFEPVIWAYSEGVTTGTTASRFAPESTCTRAQVVTFLWRAMGKPETSSPDNPFEDVKESDYFYKPVLWAIEKGITTGTSAKRFSPDVTCTNAHILTFIWRAIGTVKSSSTGEWYSEALDWATANCLLDGTYTGDFDVNKGCPRANVVTYLFRYITADTVTVYVSADADAKIADGSAEKPFTSIEAARDYVRTLDKSKYRAIDVMVGGKFTLSSPVEFTKEDSGTESCPISYIGSGDTLIGGGFAFTAKDFAPATGSAAQYFKADAKANIVEIDLKQFGITKADIAAMYATPETGKLVQALGNNIPLLYVDGSLATVAREPNDEYATITEGVINSENGEYSARDYVDTTTITISDEYVEGITASFHDISKVFCIGRFSSLWCNDNSRVLSLDGNKMEVYFAGGHTPKPGMFFYLQNAPEMLDAPGEYYVDDDAVLYYYKGEGFETSSFSIPRSENLFTVNGAEYLTIKNFTLESTKSGAVTAKADHFTLADCDVRASGSDIVLSGDCITVENNYFHNFLFGVISIEGGGDRKTLTPSYDLITNNEFENWGILGRTYYTAVNLKNSCGVVVSHNEMHDAPHAAITWSGNNNIFEYNEIYDVCNDTDDAAAVYSYADSYINYGNTMRYNYIHDIRMKNERLTKVPNYPYCHVSAIYWDGGKAGQIAQYNILENVDGSGVIGSGRDETITNNLFISCGWGLDLTGWFYDEAIKHAGGTAGDLVPYKDNKAWQEAYPSLYKLDWTYTEKSLDDPLYYLSPGGVVAKNNYFYFDKSNIRSIGTYGSGHIYQNWILDSVKKFSADTIEDTVEGVNQTTYTSKRTPITAADVIEKTSDVTGITMEEFTRIGIKK